MTIDVKTTEVELYLVNLQNEETGIWNISFYDHFDEAHIALLEGLADTNMRYAQGFVSIAIISKHRIKKE